MLGQGNAGDYDYASTVAYPFGYGLSYTTFDWSDFSAGYDAASDSFTVNVTVTNTGSVAGKEVVQVYFQSPYTDYDRQNGIEKASVELCGFDKTELLEPGASETCHHHGAPAPSWPATTPRPPDLHPGRRRLLPDRRP